MLIAKLVINKIVHTHDLLTFAILLAMLHVPEVLLTLRILLALATLLTLAILLAFSHTHTHTHNFTNTSSTINTFYTHMCGITHT